MTDDTTPAPTPAPTPADAFATAAKAFVMAIATPELSDRDAAWMGMEAILAGFTAGLVDAAGAAAASKRLRKLTF